MAFPPIEPLFADLCALRDASDPCDPRHDARWRSIARWIAQAFPAGELEDARQEALVSLMRGVSSMRAEAAPQAAKWIATIVKRKRLDALRARARDPVHRAIGIDARSPDRPPLIERLEADDGASPTPAMLASLVATVLDHVERALEESEPSASKRLLRRTQAQATLLRLVCGAPADSIERALEYGEPIGRDRLYKWIERGRPVVLLGLDRFAREEDATEIVEALREIVEERRADAGVPRPDRRKAPSEEGK